MKQYIIKDRQSLFDVAVQLYGSASMAFEIAVLNGLEIASTLEIGTIILLPALQKEDKVTRVYELNKIYPATALQGDDMRGGIDYMGIEIDFLIR